MNRVRVMDRFDLVIGPDSRFSWRWLVPTALLVRAAHARGTETTWRGHAKEDPYEARVLRTDRDSYQMLWDRAGAYEASQARFAARMNGGVA